jgi:hypothetical protein
MEAGEHQPFHQRESKVQNSNTYWAQVKVAFDEHKLVDPNFNKVQFQRAV